MTAEELREIDARIAEKVFGEMVFRDHWFYFFQDDERVEVPHYSKDFAAAMKIVEELAPADDEFRLVNFHRQAWRCTFRFFDYIEEEAETIPLAICKAALRLKGIEA